MLILFVLHMDNDGLPFYSPQNKMLSRCRVGIGLGLGATTFKIESVGVFLTPTDKNRASACTLLPPISKQM